VTTAVESDPPREHLALIGGRGCGKTSAAARLAADHQGFRLVDLDALIVAEAGGRTVPEIVDDGGWALWRELEYRVLQRETAIHQPALVDCGGGIVVDFDKTEGEIFSPRKVEVLRERCWVVYLRCNAELLWSRVATDSNRPALSNDRSFQALMAQRESWYQSAADWVIEADSLDPDELAQQIAQWFFAPGRGGPPGH
jgi:shikimate kinase